jgi:hypothetical protein
VSSFLDIFDPSRPGKGGHRSWRFEGADSNQSARRLFKRLDLVLERLKDPAWVFVATIELDAGPGQFPAVLVSFFEDPAWDYTTRFYLGPILKNESEPQYTVGELVFEMRDVQQLFRLLALGDGFRWGTGLRLGGVQVLDSAVATAIEGSPFDPEHAARLERVSRLGWAASSDLDKLSIWISPNHDDLIGNLADV